MASSNSGNGKDAETAATAQVERVDFTIPFNKEIKSKTTASEIPTSKYHVSSNDFKSSRNLSLIFAHGASGSMHTPAVAHFLEGFAPHHDSVTFQGNMNLKGRVKQFKAVAKWCQNNQEGGESTDGVAATSLVLGGRSMGARAAVIAATELESGPNAEDAAADDIATNVQLSKKLILVSYPLVSPKEDLRDQILLDLDDSWEVLFISGTRDDMCPFEKLEDVRREMRAKTWLVRVVDADHGMNMKGGAKVDSSSVINKTGQVAASWLEERFADKSEGSIRWAMGEAEGVSGKAQWSEWQAVMPEEAEGGEKLASKQKPKAGKKEDSKQKAAAGRREDSKQKATAEKTRDHKQNKTTTDEVNGGRDAKVKKRQKSSTAGGTPSTKSRKRKNEDVDEIERPEESEKKQSAGDGPASRTRKRVKAQRA